MRHFASLKSPLLLAALAASLSLPLPAAAEKGAEIYSHEHRESHTTTRTESSTHTSSSTTSTHSSSSVSLDKEGSAEILGNILVPNPHRKVPQLDRISRQASLTPVFAGRDQQGRWGLWDSQGRQLLAPHFKKLEAGKNGSIMAWEDKKAPRYLTRDGQPAQDPASLEGLYPFKEKRRWGFQDASGKTVLAPVYQAVLTGFSEGIAFVKNSKGRTVAIDTQGKELFAAPYDHVFPFQDGLAETRRKVRSFNWASAVGAALGSALWDTSVYDPEAPLSLTWDGVKRGYIDRSGQIIIDDRNDSVFPMTPWGTFVKDKGELWFANSPTGRERSCSVRENMTSTAAAWTKQKGWGPSRTKPAGNTV